jgi:proteasome lid subunit RPN8/RPN11
MVSAQVWDLTPEETVEVLREEVQRVYGLSLEEYRRARAAGTLPCVPNAARDEVQMFDVEALMGESVAGCAETESFNAS